MSREYKAVLNSQNILTLDVPVEPVVEKGLFYMSLLGITQIFSIPCWTL